MSLEAESAQQFGGTFSSSQDWVQSAPGFYLQPRRSDRQQNTVRACFWVGSVPEWREEQEVFHEQHTEGDPAKKAEPPAFAPQLWKGLAGSAGQPGLRGGCRDPRQR